MSQGIFISYSREDEKQALHLLSVLRREGYNVWIDQEAIAGASIWSDEIVQNIKSSEIFIALLSASSVASPNVGKEIALAAEHGKIILPIEIGTVTLPGRLEYALAGIQRTNFHDEQAILHAIRSQVARIDGTQTRNALDRLHLNKKRLRSRIVVGSLATIVIAVSAFMFFRRSAEPAHPENTIVVLPFATLNIDRDSTRNLDVFSDELVTRISKIASLQVTSASVSAAYKETRLNPMAIANELHARFMVDGLVRKARDVNYISVRVFDAKKGGQVWEQTYCGNNRVLFALREHVCNELLGFLYDVTNTEREIQQSEQEIARHPNNASEIAHLATRLMGSDKARSLALFDRAIKLDSSNISYYLNAGIVAERASDGRSREYGQLALPIARKQLKMFPDSGNLSINYVVALDVAGESAQAGAIYDSLLRLHPTDVRLHYNAACCFSRIGNTDHALDLLQQLLTLAPGKRGEVQSDPDFDNIRSSPRYLNLVYGF